MLTKIYNFLSGLLIIGLAVVFVKWYVKGHFGKYFYLFWLNTILAIGLHFQRESNEVPYDTRTGAQVWEQTIK